MTPAGTCPVHGPLPGLGTFCARCDQYVEDMEGATTDVTPEARETVKDTRTEAEVTIALPWHVLASDNLRKRYAPGKDNNWKEYKACRDAAHLEAMKQVRRRPVFAGVDVAVSIAFWLPDRRRRDPNNLTKMICDALTGVAYEDDAQIADLRWTRAGYDKADPRAVLTIARRTA